MVNKSELAIATSQPQNPIPFLIELLFNLLSKIITISTIKLTCHPVRKPTPAPFVVRLSLRDIAKDIH